MCKFFDYLFDHIYVSIFHLFIDVNGYTPGPGKYQLALHLYVV